MGYRWLVISAALWSIACAGCSSSAQTSPDLAVVVDAGAADASAMCPADAAPHCRVIDDAGVSHGCVAGGMGPGDRDDGGGMTAPPVDASADAMNLPFGAQCLNNTQCLSNICFDYRVKGQFCTQFCSCNFDCPAGTLGCGGQGVCRIGN
jgi:hypothetical protein